MKFQTLLMTLCLSTLGLASAGAVVIVQDTGDDFVKFQAGSYDSLTGTSDLQDNGDGTLTTIDDDASYNGLVTYNIQFTTTGTYYLYFKNTADAGGNDSLFVTEGDWNTTPSGAGNGDRWNNLEKGTNWDQMSTDNTTYGSSNSTTLISWEVNTADNYSVTLRSREPIPDWEDFVFSQDANLSDTQLNDLEYTAVVPEPQAGVLLLAGLAGVLFIRRRGLFSC